MDVETAIAVSMLPVSRIRAAAAFHALRHEEGIDHLDAVLESCGIAPAQRVACIDRAGKRSVRALKLAARIGAVPIPIHDPRYPPLLSCIVDPPPVLWTRGPTDCLAAPAVAIVGSRAATSYALEVAARLGRELAERGITVISGLARGVDSAAHRGCLEGGGRTVAVLGSGLDRLYPPEHDELAQRICRKGLVASELGPSAAPRPEHFPLRNRIISGISLAVVIVEASERSGSLITARCALDQGRDVMAVPGSVLSGRNRGSHSLLKDGAKIVETADDILDELGWFACHRHAVKPSKSLTEDALLRQMEDGEVYGLEELMTLTGLPASRLLSRLTELELSGLVATEGPGRYTKAERTT